MEIGACVYNKSSNNVGGNWTFDFTGDASEDLWTSCSAHGLVVGESISYQPHEIATFLLNHPLMIPLGYSLNLV